MLDAVKNCAEIMKEHNAKLYIYGPDHLGRYANVERMIAERQIGDLVVLNHEVFGEVKENILLDADIFIQTSRTEGMPLGILEAMGYGIPCLATEGTTFGAVIEQNGLGWGSATDGESVAKQMQNAILNREEWKQKGENARAFIQNHFVWDKVSVATIKTYEQFVGGNKR